jgi:hypothetical protein
MGHHRGGASDDESALSADPIALDNRGQASARFLIFYFSLGHARDKEDQRTAPPLEGLSSKELIAEGRE